MGPGPGPGQSFTALLEPRARPSHRGRPVGASPSRSPSDPCLAAPPPSLCLPPLTSILRISGASYSVFLPPPPPSPYRPLLGPFSYPPFASREHLRSWGEQATSREARMSESSLRACPRAPGPPTTSCPTSLWGPGAGAALLMGPCMGAREGTPGGCTERGDCLAGGGAGAGAGSQAGGFVCEKNRGLARVGTLASLNANGARCHRLLSSPRGPAAPPPTHSGEEWAQ